MLSMILPTYDEAENIVPLLRGLRRELDGIEHEVVVVDDDSPDGTWKLVEAERAAMPGLVLLRRVGRRGLTSAIQDGVRAARGEIVGWMDCDFSAQPSVVPRLVAKIREGYDVAVASRYVPGGSDARSGSPLRRAASKVIVELARALLVPGFRDYTSGFVVVRRAAYDCVGLRGDYGESFMDFIVRAHRREFRIVEIPHALVPRRAGRSKTDSGFLRKGLKYLAMIGRLRFESRGAE